MAQSISNMNQVWMSNTNTYNAIAMSVSTLGYGASANSSLLILNVDGSNKFRVDAGGRVTKPSQPMVYAGRTGGGWTNYNTGSNYVFNTAYVNNGNCLNTSTGIFTCPVAGYYRVAAGAIMGLGGASCYFYLRKNGSNYGMALHYL